MSPKSSKKGAASSTKQPEAQLRKSPKNLQNNLKKVGKNSKATEMKQEEMEFGGLVGALYLMTVTPLTIIYLYFFCNESSCSFTIPPSTSKLLSLSTYYDRKAFLFYLAYCFLLALLSLIPVGGKKVTGLLSKQGRLTYNMNGFFSFFVLLSLLIGLEISGYGPVDFVIEHIFHLLIAAILVGIYLTTHAFIRSYFVPVNQLGPHCVGKNFIYNYFMGRELNPRIFGVLDLKMYVFRLSGIGSLLLDFILLYKSTGDSNSSITLSPTILTLILLRVIYHFDGLIHESVWVTSFEIQYESFGYMGGVGYSIWPFMTAALTKYLLDFKIELENWRLALIIATFLAGYILLRASNNQKDAFRKNPNSPQFSKAVTITTSQGRKLLASGYWGIVRHPNYLGDVLINVSFILFAPFVPPVLTPVSSLTFLVHRSVRDNWRCKQKYGPSWDQYCSKVKYILIPKIY